MSVFDILKRVAGTLWSRVIPEQPRIPNPPLDAREHAIAALLGSLAGVTFEIENPPGPPAAFRIPRSHLLDEWPDALKSLTFPSIVVLPGDPVIIPRGLANSVDESTHDTFGRGTAVLPLHEHQERIVLEIWATTRFQRAAIVAGLQRAFDPAEEMSGIRITLPDYLGQVAGFTLQGGRGPDHDHFA